MPSVRQVQESIYSPSRAKWFPILLAPLAPEENLQKTTDAHGAATSDSASKLRWVRSFGTMRTHATSEGQV